MAGSRLTAGVDLFLDLRGTKSRSSLERALREAIRTGRLVPGSPVPSSRALAVQLELSRNTVAEAYSQLVAEGWMTAQQGSGTRVAHSEFIPNASPADAAPIAPGSRRMLDLSPGSPDLSHFPRAAWLRASRRALGTTPAATLGYPDPRGLPGLRSTLVEYLARARGVQTTVDRLVICSGFAQALALLARAIRASGGERLFVESYGLPEHRAIAHSAGLSLLPIGIDETGVRTEDLGEGAGVLLTPSHQFPTGLPLTSERRRTVVDWARASGSFVIEDDYDGEFRFDRRPIGSLQGVAPDAVAYVGTASKSLAPGLSLAWLALPPGLVDAVVEEKIVSDGFTGVFEQLALEEFIRSGDYDRHIRQSRVRYRSRRDLLVSTLARRCPAVVVTGVAAGLHAVVEHTGRLASEEVDLQQRARSRGLDVRTLDSYRFGLQRNRHAALVVGYGSPSDRSFPETLDALCDVLA